MECSDVKDTAHQQGSGIDVNHTFHFISTSWLSNGNVPYDSASCQVSRGILWSKDVSSYTHISADNNNIYISEEQGKVVALDRLTGEVVWEQADLLYRSLSGPTALGKYVIVSDFAGYVHVLSKADGQIVGRSKLGGGGLAGASIVHKGAIYSMTNSGNLVSITVQESS